MPIDPQSVIIMLQPGVGLENVRWFSAQKAERELTFCTL
jgi:hypothetical protein